MKKKRLLKIAVAILCCSIVSYEHIHGVNELTAMRIEIPQIERDIAMLSEEIEQLAYECQLAENPQHLLYLAKNPEFSDLQYPTQDDVIILAKEKLPVLIEPLPETLPIHIHPVQLSVIFGAF
jgi:hypothetical protein